MAETVVTLETVGGGAAGELFAREFEKVLANIQDPNTDAQAVREVNVKVRIKPGADRESSDTYVIVTSKLAGIKPVKRTMYLATRNGKLVATEFDPKQPGLFDAGGSEVLPINRGKEATK
jgi:hypothetical protein